MTKEDHNQEGTEQSMWDSKGKLGVIGAIFVPFILVSAFTILTDKKIVDLNESFYLYGYVACIIGGLVCFIWIPIRPLWKILLSVVYAIVLFSILSYYQFLFAIFVLREVG